VIPRPGYVRIITADRQPPADRDLPVTLDLFQAAVDEALGRHVELRAARWLTRFGNAGRQAAEYVRGRVLLAGDAAHIHPPAGAIGVNLALDDAGDRLAPLTDLLTRVARHPEGNRAFAEIITRLDTRYAMHPQSAHPWLGRLAPNLALTTQAGDTDVPTLLAAGRALLLDLAEDAAIGECAARRSSQVDIVRATCPAHPKLRAILLRPDGHTAWLSTADHANNNGLQMALNHWHAAARVGG
jgi:hypothetical protein